MASSIDFNDFIVTKSEKEKCEFEVTSKAMDYYKKYPCYDENSKWKPIVFQNSINVYYSSNKEERKEYESKSASGYKGAHLLVNEELGIALTSDILTSIKYPTILLMFEGKTLNGEGLCDFINDIDICKYSYDMKDLYPYMKAFAKVYYWCGNMMPVPSNPNRGMHGVDHWRYKIEHIKNCFDIKNYDGSKLNFWKKDWYEWIEKLINQQKEINDFINDYFLEDCFVNGTDLKNMNETNSLISSSNQKQKIDWLINNTKFIIQRSYRIQNDFHGEWYDKDKENVQQIFKIVFETTGLNYENDQELQELF